MTPEKPFSVLLADYLRAAIIDYNNGSAEDTRNAEDACGLVLAEYARMANDLSEDLHSAARCGVSGPSCPGCVIANKNKQIRGLNEGVDTMRKLLTEIGLEVTCLKCCRIPASAVHLLAWDSPHGDERCKNCGSGLDIRQRDVLAELAERDKLTADLAERDKELTEIKAAVVELAPALPSQAVVSEAVAHAVTELDPAREESLAQRLDRDLAVIMAKAGADKAVLEAAEAWQAAFHGGDELDPDCYTADEIALFEAIKARNEVIAGVWTQEDIDGAKARAKAQAEELRPLIEDPAESTAGGPEQTAEPAQLESNDQGCRCATECQGQNCKCACHHQEAKQGECWDCGDPMWRDRFGGWHHSRGAKDHRARTDPYATEAASVSAQAEAGR